MEPRATNELTTQKTFILRKLYKDETFPEHGPKHIDFWYNKSLYGRIDRHENVVVPKVIAIKQYPSDNGSYFGLNFVVDAFVGLQSAFEKGMMLNTVATAGTVYSGLRIRRGIQSTSNVYYDYLQILHSMFIDSYLQAFHKMSEITTFKAYITEFIKYLDDRLPFAPITKSGFMTSMFATPYMSGLVLELRNEDHASDLPKKEAYIEDPNFNVFRNTAQQYGFMVDKNAPWRLVADLASPFMQRYGIPYDVKPAAGSASNIFDTHYDRVYTQDIELLKRFFFLAYETFIEMYPTARQEKVVECEGASTLKINLEERIPYNEQVYEQDYPDSFWIQLYTIFRIKEMEIHLTEPRKRVIIKDILELFPRYGFESTVKYINNRIIDMSPNRWWSHRDIDSDKDTHDIFQSGGRTPSPPPPSRRPTPPTPRPTETPPVIPTPTCTSG